MDEKSGKEPLLKEEVTGYAKNRPFWILSAKWILRVVMWVIFIAWAAFIFLYPSDFVSDLYRKWNRATEGTLFGVTGSIFLIFSAPILLIAFLATAYIVICGEEEIHEKKTSRYPRFRLWTFPVLVDGPFGVVSAAEMIGIVLFTAYVIWAFYAETVKNSEIVSWFHLPSKERRYSTAVLQNILSFLMICLVYGNNTNSDNKDDDATTITTKFHIRTGKYIAVTS